MHRTVQPEILDSLPHDHPDALHNRRDLRVINGLMGNHRWFSQVLPPLLRPGESVLELGAGTGDLGRLLQARGITVAGLDLAPRPADWPQALSWHQGDLRRFTGYDQYPVVIANLILHQFGASDLLQLGGVLRSGARAILATEPTRQRRSQALFAALGPLLGANYVSRHDGRVSIAAGFLGDELPLALGLKREEWEWSCTETLRGAYHLVATRKR